MATNRAKLNWRFHLHAARLATVRVAMAVSVAGNRADSGAQPPLALERPGRLGRVSKSSIPTQPGVMAMRAMGFPRSVPTHAAPCSGPKYRAAARSYSGLTSASISTLARPRTSRTLCGHSLPSIVSAARGSAASALSLGALRGRTKDKLITGPVKPDRDDPGTTIHPGVGQPRWVSRPQQGLRNRIIEQFETALLCHLNPSRDDWISDLRSGGVTGPPSTCTGPPGRTLRPSRKGPLAAHQDDRAADSAQAKAEGFNETNQSHRMDQRLLILSGS